MPTSFAHWVFGTPPRHRNRKLVSIIRSSPVSQFLSVTAPNMSSPCNATTSDLGTIYMFGLCGRIARTQDDDVLVATKLGFACASPIIDAGAEQLFLVW